MQYALPLVFLATAALLYLGDRGAVPVGVYLTVAALAWIVGGESGA
jgi:hypothetical protein